MTGGTGGTHKMYRLGFVSFCRQDLVVVGTIDVGSTAVSES